MKCTKADCRAPMWLDEKKYTTFIRCTKCTMRMNMKEKEDTIKYFEEMS